MLGPGEDAGTLHLGEHDGERYGVVVAHESHNHPSQVVPFEGAATGIGGIVRDVLCMGAEVIAVADPLRFGRCDDANRIARYVARGRRRRHRRLRQRDRRSEPRRRRVLRRRLRRQCAGQRRRARASSKSRSSSIRPRRRAREGWEIVLVGKATDPSGFGGASFSSVTLDADEAELNKGAVQVPDPFLKNVLMRASYRVFALLREKKIVAGFKDLGAGGIVGCSAEITAQRRLRRRDRPRPRQRRRRGHAARSDRGRRNAGALALGAAAGDRRARCCASTTKSSRCPRSRTTRAPRRRTRDRRAALRAAPSRRGRDGRRDRVPHRLDPRRTAVHRGDPPRRRRRRAAGGRRRAALSARARASRRLLARAALPALRRGRARLHRAPARHRRRGRARADSRFAARRGARRRRKSALRAHRSALCRGARRARSGAPRRRRRRAADRSHRLPELRQSAQARAIRRVRRGDRRARRAPRRSSVSRSSPATSASTTSRAEAAPFPRRRSSRCVGALDDVGKRRNARSQGADSALLWIGSRELAVGGSVLAELLGHRRPASGDRLRRASAPRWASSHDAIAARRPALVPRDRRRRHADGARAAGVRRNAAGRETSAPRSTSAIRSARPAASSAKSATTREIDVTGALRIGRTTDGPELVVNERTLRYRALVPTSGRSRSPGSIRERAHRRPRLSRNELRRRDAASAARLRRRRRARALVARRAAARVRCVRAPRRLRVRGSQFAPARSPRTTA